MVSYARSSALVVFAALVSACTISEESRVIRYETLAMGEGIIYNGLAFSEEKGLMVGYVKPYSNHYLEEPTDFNSAVFRYRDVNGILVESGTNLSIPRDINLYREV